MIVTMSKYSQGFLLSVMFIEYYSITVKLVQEEAIIDMLHILLHTANPLRIQILWVFNTAINHLYHGGQLY